MNVHYFSADASEEAYVRSRGSAQHIVFHAGSLVSAADIADAQALSVFIDSKITADVIERLPALRLIATRSTGYDHIDIAAAKKRNIAVANVPVYGEKTVAEFAFALILTLSRKILEANDRVRHAASFSLQGLQGFDLSGKTLGVVGVGHIGAHVIRIAKGFDMQVLAFDVNQNQHLRERLGFAYVSLDDLLARSDVISIHVPYNQATHHLINQTNIRKIKKGAYLINTARGGIVETEALVLGLREEILGGAGLDVLEEEGNLAEEDLLLFAEHPNEAKLKTMLANNWLLKHPRVIVTPHLAFDSREAVYRIIDTTLLNIQLFSEGKPQNIVT